MTAQLSKKKLFGLRQPDRKSLSVNEWMNSQHASFFSQTVIVPKGMLVIAGIHLSVSFTKKVIANLGISVRSSIRTRLGANPGNE